MKWNDFFCGAGGSSTGLALAGHRVWSALNHSELSLSTHHTNHPDALHLLVDLMQGGYPVINKADFAWFSPECRKHKAMKDNKRKNSRQLDMFSEKKPKPEEIRSRMNPWTVPVFAEAHGYKCIVVENIIEFRRYWEDYDEWVGAMKSLGYHYQALYHNAQFFNPVASCGEIESYAPQSRDRIYVVFTKKGNPIPDFTYKPLAWCERCACDVLSVQSWKKPSSRFGIYGRGGQYVYRCPHCTSEVRPYFYAAANAIDWTVQGERIGDKKRPLKPATLQRVAKGLSLYGDMPFVLHTAYSKNRRPGNTVRDISQVNFTQTTRNEVALVVNNRGNPDHAVGSGAITQPTVSSTTTNVPWPIVGPTPSLTTVEGLAFVSPESEEVQECHYRMFEPDESKRSMGFGAEYVVLGNRRQQVAQVGNAVAVPNAEFIAKRIEKAFYG